MKSRNPTEKAVLRWIKQGYGQGLGLAYKPFFYIRDIPSDGRSTALEGLKIPRTHHYFSDVEYHYHLLAEYSDDVVEIREQYALLPCEETKLIADRLGIAHPIYSATRAQRVITSDLVLSVKRGDEVVLVVLCCKVASDVAPSNPEAARTLEKILLEKVYWEARNAEWRLVTDKMLPGNKIHNLEFFRGSMVSWERDYLNTKIAAFVQTALAIWNDCVSLNDLLITTSLQLNLDRDECFCLLGRSIWTKALPVDLDSGKFGHEDKLPLLNALEATCFN